MFSNTLNIHLACSTTNSTTAVCSTLLAYISAAYHNALYLAPKTLYNSLCSWHIHYHCMWRWNGGLVHVLSTLAPPTPWGGGLRTPEPDVLESAIRDDCRHAHQANVTPCKPPPHPSAKLAHAGYFHNAVPTVLLPPLCACCRARQPLPRRREVGGPLPLRTSTIEYSPRYSAITTLLLPTEARCSLSPHVGL